MQFIIIHWIEIIFFVSINKIILERTPPSNTDYSTKPQIAEIRFKLETIIAKINRREREKKIRI